VECEGYRVWDVKCERIWSVECEGYRVWDVKCEGFGVLRVKD